MFPIPRTNCYGDAGKCVCTRLLALADVFSDVGFIATVFILRGTKYGGPRLSLLVIGILSTATVVVAQLYMPINNFVGLTSKKIMKEISSDTPTVTLFEYFHQDQGMQMKYWFIFGDWIDGFGCGCHQIPAIGRFSQRQKCSPWFSTQPFDQGGFCGRFD